MPTNRHSRQAATATRAAGGAAIFGEARTTLAGETLICLAAFIAARAGEPAATD
ncbi:hypothetical protein [Neorhizobium sp. DT-125]|uniref:hypothetical protein n=1 Tax=Neorhizobium sp. DT-125 TaxID=3396163 RepID=UPI003F1CA0FF